MTCIVAYGDRLPGYAESLGCSRFRVTCVRVEGDTVCLACCDPNGVTIGELYTRLVS